MPGPGPISSPDSEDDAVTRVGKLPPELQRYQQNPTARSAQPPAAAPAPAQPRKNARRRTLSRGEQSPLAQGRRPTHDGQPREPRGGHGHGHQAHGHSEARSAQTHAAEPRKHAGRGGQLPSEVPTAPGNDARAGAARAAALRALAVVDDEVTAQRDVAVLQRLKELKDLAVDDLDEDTSVLPGLKIKEATAAAIAAKKAAEEQARAGASFAAVEDDRPTPTDADAELSATTPPDTSRTSVVTVEANAPPAQAIGADTGRYSAIDALWVTSDSQKGPSSRGRSLTVQNPAAVAEAAAADAAVAAAHAAQAAAAQAQLAAQASGSAGRAAPPAARSVAEQAAVPVAASPVCAFRVAVFPADRPGGSPRVVALAPGSAPPAGATAGMLVATTDAESAELARIFGYAG